MKKIQNNPWKEFKNWLFASKDTELSQELIKSLNPSMILAQFSNLNTVTIFLNDVLNDFYKIYKIDPKECYNFLKDIVIKKKINPNDLCYIPLGKMETSKEIKKAREKLPNLKFYEIELLLELCMEDQYYNGFMEFLEIKRNTTNKDKKPVKNNNINGITMKTWLSNFSIN